MKTKFYYLTFRDGSSKQYEVIIDTIKNEGEFITFEAVNPFSPKETTIHSINTRNINSIDYYDSLVDLVGNINPEAEPKGYILRQEKQSTFSKETYILFIFDLVLLLLIVLLNK